MKFTYEAKKGVDEKVKGEIEASSKDQAISLLIDKGLFPIAVEGIEEDKSNLTFAVNSTASVSSRDVLSFSRSLRVLIRAKVELMQAVIILAEQSKDKRQIRLFERICKDLRDGQSLSDALSRFPDVFTKLYINVIRAGELSGDLENALAQNIDYMQRKEELKHKIVNALIYPAMLLLVGISSIYILISFVVPKLKPVLSNMGEELPFITKVIFSLGDISNQSFKLFLLIFFSLILFVYVNRKSEIISKVKNWILQRMPIVSKLLYKQEVVNFTRALVMLLNSKIAILDALKMAKNAIGDEKIEKELMQVCIRIGDGESLGKSLRQETSFPDFLIKMISVGEKSGRLNDVLGEVIETYEQEINSDIEIMSSFIEPVLILVLGIVLGIIVLSILIPMFQITQNFG